MTNWFQQILARILISEILTKILSDRNNNAWANREKGKDIIPRTNEQRRITFAFS